MKLYQIDDKGNLKQLNKLDFLENEIYLVDDEKTIYLWIGQDVPLNQQDLVVKKARELNRERGGAAKLLLMNQEREYGAFLANKNDPYLSAVIAGALAGLAGFLVNGMFDWLFGDAEVVTILWLSVGLVVAARNSSP